MTDSYGKPHEAPPNEKRISSLSPETAIHKMTCAHCQQDWIYLFRRMDTGERFHLCPECESVWLEGGDLRLDTDVYLSEFMSPADPGREWEVIEPADQ
ncbi:hypothetical protein [Streptomyces radiopugnans]|uniref:hypothetical protein n=1 Tax=Streptomyces radiopugnans TaxID=403935 RepID=UPI003F1C86B8